jgi:hypothetical protein
MSTSIEVDNPLAEKLLAVLNGEKRMGSPVSSLHPEQDNISPLRRQKREGVSDQDFFFNSVRTFR